MGYSTKQFNGAFFALKQQNAWLSAPRRKPWVLIVVLGFILSWQVHFARHTSVIETRYHREDATGFAEYFAQHFIYFYYYLDLFPVATAYTPLEYSRQGAEKALTQHGDSLLMEWGHWSRLGENARILMYLPDAWVKGSPENPRIFLCNALLLMTALLAVFIAFWYYNMPLPGFFIVLFFGSSPYLLYESYVNINIFAILQTTTLFVLAVNLPFMLNRHRNRWLWLMPVLSGLLIATASQVRAEATIITVSCIFIYFTIGSAGWIKRFLLAAVLLLSFYMVNHAWYYCFDVKFEQAKAVVIKYGGNPYNGPRIRTHTFWHPFYCGLDDYDNKYGYTWDDRASYSYALPIMKTKYGISLAYDPKKYGLDEYYDVQKKYYKKIELIPEYEQVLKEKVLRDIKNDPLWFANIIRKRVHNVFTILSPIWITFGKRHIQLPFWGYTVFIFIAGMMVFRRWFEVKLLLFSFPLATTSILIYSLQNTTYNCCYHLFAAALAGAWGVEALWLLALYLRKRIGN